MSHDTLPAPPETSEPGSPMGAAHSGKRRIASSASSLPALPPPEPAKPKPAPEPLSLCDMRASRRRKLVVYTAAFATMLALSAVLDVRRATLRDRHAKVQLTLPSGTSLSSISAAAPPDNPAPEPHPDASLSLRPFGLAPRPNDRDAPAQSAPAGLQPPTATDGDAPKKDPNLSEQELKDDVDQLIAHVDEEAAVDATIAAGNASSTTAVKTPVAAPNVSEGARVEPLGEGPAPAASANATETQVRLNSEDHFSSAQKRLDAMLADEDTKAFVDENDLRTLQALALQATRGDCEHKGGSEGGSLFKTDAEAASNLDIERTDALWGAWCLFMGSYKTDAMRDYVTKQTVLEEKVTASRVAAAENRTLAETSFDPNAASLDDIMTPEQQSGLRLQTDRIMSHLREYDVRYLAALSLQATFGDCGPYGEELQTVSKDSEQKKDLRILREPLLEQTVTRREGAQWGAWCVLQGKKRTSAAAELSHRLDLLVDQLSKTEAAAEVAVEDPVEDKDETVSAGGAQETEVSVRSLAQFPGSRDR